MRYRIVRAIVWTLLRLLLTFTGGIRIEGKENVPQTGGVLITPNHISDADPPVVGFALPRFCYFMAKEELFSIRFWGTLIRWLHGFPVKRYTADRASLRYTEERLKEGEAVVIFPEGQLSETGKLMELLPGALLVAQRANVPIVPTILLYTNDLMPYGELKPRRIGKPLIVRFGKPVTMAELTGGTKGSEGLKLAAVRLREILLKLQGYNEAIQEPQSEGLPDAKSETPSAHS